MATLGSPGAGTAPVGAEMTADSLRQGLPQVADQSQYLTVSDRQRSYLDALEGAGVQPSDELLALSIGSYVCQARAAKQSPRAVRDFVLPLVRSDFDDFSDPRDPDDPRSTAGARQPSAAAVDAATAEYIRIATEQLC